MEVEWSTCSSNLWWVQQHKGLLSPSPPQLCSKPYITLWWLFRLSKLQSLFHNIIYRSSFDTYPWTCMTSSSTLSPNPQSLHSKVFPNTLAGFPSCQVKPTLLPKLSTPAMLISLDQEWFKYWTKYHPFTSATFQSQLCGHVLCLVGSNV
jgi:hypothetical protein